MYDLFKFFIPEDKPISEQRDEIVDKILFLPPEGWSWGSAYFSGITPSPEMYKSTLITSNGYFIHKQGFKIETTPQSTIFKVSNVNVKGIMYPYWDGKAGWKHLSEFVKDMHKKMLAEAERVDYNDLTSKEKNFMEWFDPQHDE